MANYIDQKKKNLLQNQESQETPATAGYQQGADGKQADALLQQINNREKFSYDMEQDPLYQQYKRQAIQYGQRAMQDTMGQAAALTGGYGSSYSQSAGQQAYQNYLQKLNEQVPQLYQLALNQYNQQGQDLKDRYALYADREAQSYSRYLDSLAQQQWNQQFAYQQDRDAVADQQWQQQFDADQAYQQWQQQFSQQQFDTQNQQWQQQFDADQAYQQWQQNFSQQQFDTQNQQWQKEFDLAAQKAAAGDRVYYQNINQDPVAQPVYADIISQELPELAKTKSAKEIDEYLTAALNAGYISQIKYGDLRAKYVTGNTKITSSTGKSSKSSSQTGSVKGGKTQYTK